MAGKQVLEMLVETALSKTWAKRLRASAALDPLLPWLTRSGFRAVQGLGS